jgi:hypothetical protein
VGNFHGPTANEATCWHKLLRMIQKEFTTCLVWSKIKCLKQSAGSSSVHLETFYGAARGGNHAGQVSTVVKQYHENWEKQASKSN